MSVLCREQQQCFRGGQRMKSLWRSADSDRQITLVSQTDIGHLQHRHSEDQVVADVVLLKCLLENMHACINIPDI